MTGRAPTALAAVSVVLAAWVATAASGSRPARGNGPAPESVRRLVEADWERQDEDRLREIREPGVLRFPGAEVQWPGVGPTSAARLPCGAAPELDGRADEPAWRQALSVPAAAPDAPAFRMFHDWKRLYVAASLPTHTEWRYRGGATAADAGGAVDGIKDGRYAFHTGYEPNPWWQVDLGSPRAIARIVVYNRLDYPPGLHNADILTILTSDDAATWTRRYDNKGKHFGGVGDGGPLEVRFPGEGVTARYVRLQLPSAAPLFFHLDEVEVYGRDEPERNLALRRPCSQSSLSIWSRGGPLGSALLQFGGVRVEPGGGGDSDGVLANGSPLAAARLVREGGTTSVELALPLRDPAGVFPGQVAVAGGTTLPLRLGANWELVWPATSPGGAGLGFGRNRLALELRAPGRLDPPAEVWAETVVLTPFGLRRWRSATRRVLGAGPVTLEANIAHEGPAALTVVVRQGQASWEESRAFFVHPAAEALRRTEWLLSDFGLPAPPELRPLRQRIAALAQRERVNGADPAARAALYRAARWLARETALRNPLLPKRLLFVKRFTQQAYPDVCLNHMPWVSRPGGDLCVLSPLRPDGQVRPLLRGALGPGHVHGADLWWDGSRIVFGYARARSADPPEGWLDRTRSYELRRTEEPIHIFEIGADGRGLRQLTDSEWSDLDPTYLPNGDIAFVSERCGFSLQCNEYDKDETSCNLYVMRPDGSGIRRLTVTKDGDYLPHALDSGVIGYTRWEYHERSWAFVQSLWTVRPDGTGADAVFKQHFNDPWAVEEARSIPGSRRLVAIATGHHTLPAGPIVILDPGVGINNRAGIRILTPGVLPPEGGMSGQAVPEGGVRGRGGAYMNPWPLSEKHLLASYAYGGMTDEKGYALYLLDVHGTRELIYRDPGISCFAPIPLRPRPRPPVLPDATTWAHRDAVCVVTNVHEGVSGVRPGTIRYLRIAEPLGWPYDNRYGGQRYEADVKSVMLNWNPVRVLGTVPVEPDGSARFRVPADVAVAFQALDKDLMEVVRMRSFVSFQPGETRGCTGCHETRATPPGARSRPGHDLLALRRAPSRPVPPPWGERPLSFLRDVQPVFDRHCTRCHSGMRPAGSLDFSGGLTARYNRAFDTIQAARLVARSDVGDDAKVTQPYSFGSHKSRLIEVIRGSHRDHVHLGREDWERLVTWIDANAPYHGGFLNKRAQPAPYDMAADTEAMASIRAVHARRCATCHDPDDVTRTDWVDLHAPHRTRFLLAPLSQRGGGAGRCGEGVYRDTSDPDYAAVRAVVERMVRQSWERPRRDVATLERPQRQARR